MPAFPRRCTFLALFVLVAIASPALAQSGAAKKLPSAEKIVSDYLKAIGGKKAAAAQRDEPTSGSFTSTTSHSLPHAHLAKRPRLNVLN